ncbi:Xaa-Pro aminopeptidase [Erysipelothrix larvae]|uniref:Xaa-Pro aminopeptidase n=1 Tax=Erysipelothrix larvae TaxID=1514105 RepID=A0A0X8H1R8_9FIRM|nr:aminopeptidase P family protein [Erysipelothrix larvae]AMC94527.1 Xaa-Pro aminopeptidase [Erysipelothrix larvae]
MNRETYIKIRKLIRDHLPKNTTTFVFSGLPIRKSADADYPFHANRNFVYATGIEEPGAVLVFDPKGDILFLRDVDESQEKWVGHYMRKEEAQDICGIKDVRYFEDFDKYLNKVLESNNRIGLDMDHNTYQEQVYGSAIGMADYVGIQRVTDVTEIFVRSRMVKFPEEVDAIKHAIKVTHESILAMLEEMKPDANENDMAARFHYEGAKQSGDQMFETIVASGMNGTVLHYIKNDEPLNDGELVLLDLGIRVNHYGADISQTYPINGTFTPRQRDIYNVVLECFEAVKAAARPGVSIIDLNELSKEKLAQGLKTLGLLERSEDIGRYYYHSVGHSLGLDTHDVWSDRAMPLEPGHVITDEPGLYIAEEGIGIRIETDLLITEDGCEDLAPFIIRDADGIEALLKEIHNT